MKRRLLMLLFAVILVLWIAPLTAYGSSEANVTFYVTGGRFSDGERSRTLTFEVGYILSEEDIPSDMCAKDGYGGGLWQEDPVGTVVESDLEFRFLFQKITQVTFDCNGGQFEDGTNSVDYPALVGWPCEDWPEEPWRDGFSFLGWGLSKNGQGDVFEEDSPISDAMILYARWRENRWLTLDANGGDWVDPLDVELPGGCVYFPDAPGREGWEFDHWNTEPDGTGEILNENDLLDVNITAYAQWRRIFILNFDGGISFSEAEFTAEQVGILTHEFTAPDLSRPGHTLLNWNTKPDGTGETVAVGGVYTVDESNNPATLYAQWQRCSYQVSFDGTDVVRDCLWGDGLCEELPEPAPFGEEGYRFGGWNTASDGTGTVFTKDTPVTGDMTLYPYWIKQVEVSFQITGGVWKENDCETYTIILDVNSPLEEYLPTPVVHREFKETGKWDKTPLKASEGAVFTFHCDARKRLQITFDTGDEAMEVLEGYSAKLPTPELQGHRFLGWYSAKNGGEEINEETVFLKNTALYARWIPVFTLTYDANGGSGAPAAEVVEDDGNSYTFTVSDVIPVREGYSFLGWADADDATLVQFEGGDPCSASRDMTLFAVWKKDVALATIYFLDRGTETAKLTIVSGNTLNEEMPEEPGRKDFRFLGWNFAEDGSGEFLTKDSIISEDTTVYAIWKEILQVTVTFIDRGREVDWFTLEAGESVGDNMPVEPSRKGYLFLGWQSETGAALEDDTAVTCDLEVFAVWEKITRGTVTFLDGESELYQITLDLGAAIGENMPIEPTAKGYRFLGWNTREDGTGSKLYRSTVVREDFTVWAQWEEIEYVALTFHNRFGETQSFVLEQNTKSGDAFPSNPSRSGYTFKGWYTEPNGAGQKISKSTKIQEDTEVYAYWRQKSSTNARTGDEFNLPFWTAVLLISASAFVCVIRRKQ